MKNKIDSQLKKNKNIKIMTHIVAGYPDLETNMEMILLMQDSGVDMVEIQIPFSDPMADGPSIMMANQTALDSGLKVSECFEFVEKIIDDIDIPLLIMTYANIPYRVGLEKFLDLSAKCGISGTIIPDLPFDEETDDYYGKSKNKNLHPISVISPDISEERLDKILSISTGFIYTTLKTGITGAQKEIQPQSLKFLERLKQKCNLPIAAGFGISSVEQIKSLKGKTDMVIIGSHLLNLFNSGGLRSVKEFLESVRTVTG